MNFGYRPRPACDLNKTSPQLFYINEEMVNKSRHGKAVGRYKRLKDDFLANNLITGTTILRRWITDSVLGTSPDSVVPFTLLHPMVMMITSVIMNATPTFKQPLLTGGMMSDNVPKTLSKQLVTKPITNVFMKSPGKAYSNDQYGEQVNDITMTEICDMTTRATITKPSKIAGLLFEPMIKTPDHESSRQGELQKWYSIRSKHRRSGGSLMASEGKRDWIVLDVSSTGSTNSEASIGEPTTSGKENEQDEDDDYSSDNEADQDWTPDNPHGTSFSTCSTIDLAYLTFYIA
jgi:hypothetical protein